MYIVLLLVLFFILIRISSKTHSDFLLSLGLFLTSSAVKVAFLFFWVSRKTGTWDLGYLQFVDEFYYVNYEWGDPISMFGGAYCIVVHMLQRIGFSYFDLKLLNIFATSFAVVRLYSLNDLVTDESKYFKLVLVIGGLLHVHIIYYSIFILKDAIVFVFTTELFVQLLRAKKYKVPWRIVVNILALAQLRGALKFLLCVFVFDRDWKVARNRLISLICLFVCFSAVSFRYVESIFLGRMSGGLYYQMDMAGMKRPTTDETRTILRRNPLLLFQIATESVKRILSPFHQKDVMGVIVLVMYYLSFFYLLYIQNNRMAILTIWPILLFPAMFLGINMLSFINMRWTLYPFGTFLYSLIFLACRPVPASLPRPPCRRGR